mmetsp:Transcript_67395/g.151373  ORF Transcript_67395/g.151373 Transcript_67395/m.151373 type:complete len:272 (-) Transcript_67395:1473-2288(-)
MRGANAPARFVTAGPRHAGRAPPRHALPALARPRPFGPPHPTGAHRGSPPAPRAPAPVASKRGSPRSLRPTTGRGRGSARAPRSAAAAGPRPGSPARARSGKSPPREPAPAPRLRAWIDSPRVLASTSPQRPPAHARAPPMPALSHAGPRRGALPSDSAPPPQLAPVFPSSAQAPGKCGGSARWRTAPRRLPGCAAPRSPGAAPGSRRATPAFLARSPPRQPVGWRPPSRGPPTYAGALARYLSSGGDPRPSLEPGLPSRRWPRGASSRRS